MAGSLFEGSGGEELGFFVGAFDAETACAFCVEVAGMMALTRILRSASRGPGLW